MDDDNDKKRNKKDPRFRFMPEFSHKIKLDRRFKDVLKEKQFKSTCPVDIRGRNVSDKPENLKRYYTLSESSGADDSLESTESSDSDSENGSSSESDIGEEGAQYDLTELDNDVIRTDDISSRLAVCNMDWDRITASDLYVILNSFVPSSAAIKSVKIYPSQFGLERMKEEEITGPRIEKVDSFHCSSSDECEEDEEQNSESLRRYQLDRLKYYYAVVECDSKESANTLYEQLDSQEYESSGNRLDLRFIPDSVEFTEEPKEVCTEMPDLTTFKPNLYFTTALFQTKVECTWDETPRDRMALTIRNFKNEEEALKTDFSAVLASSSDEEDIDAKVIQGNESDRLNAYKTLLLNSKPDAPQTGEDDLVMEITWEDENKKLISNNQTNRLSKTVEDQKLDEDRSDAKTAVKKRTKKKFKNKRSKLEDNFTVNVHDERFAKIYTSDLYSVDPSNPAFKNTEGMQAVLKESVRLKSQDLF